MRSDSPYLLPGIRVLSTLSCFRGRDVGERVLAFCPAVGCLNALAPVGVTGFFSLADFRESALS